jgi:hypothetical protein
MPLLPYVRHPVFVVSCGALLAAIAVVASPAVTTHSRATQARQCESVRVLRDDYDRSVYAERGSFLRDGTRPYADVWSEYPQLATYAFSLPYLFNADSGTHMTIFTFMMAVALGVLAAVMARLCRQLAIPSHRVLFLLLPGTLYFSLNRFDVLPTALVLTAFSLLLAGRWGSAHAVLGAAALTKGYPVLFLPLFARIAWSGGLRAMLWGFSCFVAVVVALTAQLWAWVGFNALVAPYVFQGTREANSQSIFYFAARALPQAGQWPLRMAFSGLQAGLGIVPAALRRMSPQDGARWLAIITIAFVVFTRFQSPQWVVWITPLALLSSRDRLDLGVVVAQDILTYVYFPLTYDCFGPLSTNFAFVVGALTALRVFLLVRLLMPR